MRHLALLLMLGAMLALTLPVAPSDAQTGLPSAVEGAVRADAASLAVVAPADVEIVDFEPTTWSNGCLGIEEAGRACTQALVPGFVVWAEAGGERFRYHTDAEGSVVLLAERSATAPPPAPPDAAAPAPRGTGERFAMAYVVQPGDTLREIAASFGTTVPHLAEVNGIANADLIFVGQRLLVAGDSGQVQSGEMAVRTGYVVQPGDTLWRLAARFGTTIAAIVEANQIANPDLIFAGQTLVIPG